MRLRWSLLSLFATTAAAQELPTDFGAWEQTYQFECNGPFASFAPPDIRVHGGYRYEHTGATVRVRRERAKAGAVRLGVLAGIKELDADSQAALDTFFAAFERADVEAIIVGGDTGETPEQLSQVYAYLVAATKRPLLSIAGNTERPSAHTYAISTLRKAGHHHLLNFDLIRRYDGPGFDVVSLAGYHDKAFLHLAGGCVYSDQALGDLEAAVRSCDDPVVLLAHGPPKQTGKAALDFVPGYGNVGDARLTELIRSLKVPFGTFGHIIEAGGHATDLAGRPLPPKKLHPALYVDQGSANPLPWKMNDATTSYGLAAIVTIDGKKASYEVLRAPKPRATTPPTQ